jgi:RND family efflux transporter MFP subunit
MKTLSILLMSLSLHCYSKDQLYTVQLQSVDQVRVLNGEIEAVNKATVSAQTSGRISAIHYDIDDVVEKDSIIIEFTNLEQKAQLKQAQARYQAALITYQQSQTDYERVKDIYTKKLVAKNQLDQALSNMKALKANSEAANAAIINAQEQLEYTLIRAPYDGIVTKRYIEVGETVQPGKPLMEGLSLDTLRVITHIPESMIQAVKPNPKAKVILSNGDEININKTTFFPYADSKTRTFQARLILAENQQQLYPGMTVKVAFVIGDKQVLLIPKSAVIKRSELNTVFVKLNDKSVPRQVKLGDLIGDKVEVISGLFNGDQLIIHPLNNK